MNTINCPSLPQNPSEEFIYRLIPDFNSDFYRERTDRNRGWITEDEQEIIHKSTIGIAGCGGMGGLLASIFVRLGVGEVRIADCEKFDTSNINRQYAATQNTVGLSKAFETAKMIRSISDDTTVVVYPRGIEENNVDAFLEGCDVVCDEIEFWAVGSRILLHKKARTKGISIYNCNTVGFGTRLFCFEPKGFTMEGTLNLSYREAKSLQTKIQNKTASADEIKFVMRAVLQGLVPEIPEYGEEKDFSTVSNVDDRLFNEGRAMIISTNPPMATGFLADHVLFHLLRKSGVKRKLAEPVKAPGYLYFDAGFHIAKRVER